MAVDSKFFNIPFATSGDKATIPEATQPSGAVSYTQGFGPDYERDPATDPLAKRVPRDETNEYLFQISNALKYLQWYGTPQWTAVSDGGPANYPITARVRYDAGAGMQLWQSLVATNTATPGADPTKWQLQDAFSLSALEATLAEALAGTLGTKIITPRRLASAVQQGPWNYAAAGGSANAITATLAPAPASAPAGFFIQVKIATNNTGAATLNVNGLGANPVVLPGGRALIGGELVSGSIAEFTSDGAGNWVVTGVVTNSIFGKQLYQTAGAVSFTVPAGVYVINVECWGGGAGGGGVGAGGNGSAGGGGAGGYCRARIAVTPGQVIAGSVGNRGSGGGAGGSGTAGGNTTFGGLTANGGSPGAPNPTGNGGSGGSASGGDINAAGGAGTAGAAGASVSGGPGGACSFGGAGGGGGFGVAGGGATPGGGGGGSGSAGSNSGGQGGLGSILVTW